MIKSQYRPTIFLFLISQLAIILISIFNYQSVTLLHYINISFYISCLFLFTSLIIFTVNTGFFDRITKSFRLIFSGKDVTKEMVEEMRPLSQVISFNYSPILMNGILNTFLMLIALSIYYI
ncbi:DUF3899 domain-containing protein [Cytobacillus sp. FJAT-54145]|uniref:DUF3899 domain-containing protein n=1 Tax=Cytobacillus spartinae TaxID=3299023 RepID=A0ABW6K869_9BACI